MSHLSKIFEEQPIKVQNVNGFDLSHITCGTAIVGALTPVLCRLLMQRTKFSLGCAVNVELPPLATSFFGRIDACIEVFFCPCSILYGGWKQFISNQVATMFPASQDTISQNGGYKLPLWELNLATGTAISALQAIYYCVLPYLRFQVDSEFTTDETFNLLPLICYARIWDVFYRNPQVTKTIFAVNPDINYSSSSSSSVEGGFIKQKNISYIWHSFYTSRRYSLSGLSATGAYTWVSDNVFADVSELTWPDNISAFSLRQRNYSRDYFTAGSLSPQQGNPSKLSMALDFNYDSDDPSASTITGSEFSISALRNASALQKFLEANNYDASYRGQMRAHFGNVPSDADHDEPTYLGRVVIPVYQKSVYNQDGSTTGTSGNSKNPFMQNTGARAAHGTFSGEGTITKGFKAGCFGFLFANFSLVPHTMYCYGIDRMHTMKEIGDFPFPELQSVGMDSIKNYEVFAAGSSTFDKGDFSYIPRYSYWKYIDDFATGQLRPGAPLQSFVLQRVFANQPVFGTSFCEIPKTALDAVLPVAESSVHLSCWYEIYWVLHVTQPLAAFCIPTLGDIQDTHTIKVKQGGSRL